MMKKLRQGKLVFLLRSSSGIRELDGISRVSGIQPPSSLLLHPNWIVTLASWSKRMHILIPARRKGDKETARAHPGSCTQPFCTPPLNQHMDK